ncbi:MAG TPA: RHS repeat-associated core domain-containing protein [Bacteroidales bacterium]|nr:RHS repeat-associated core domain-containing protein [Bacteroidales bacterium]
MKIHYHSDHLGSASFVTDIGGYVVQHLQYLPYGELFVSQRNSEFDTRYKFTAKELDNETSYTYFGARYYDSDLSVWLSVDPMADKYPSLSPYIYSANNPIILIDPNGEKVYIVGDAADEATAQLENNFTNIKITRNTETGELSYTGKAKTLKEQFIVKAIERTDIEANIIAENHPIYYKGHNESAVYMGNEYIEENGNKKAIGYQYVYPRGLGKMDVNTHSLKGGYMLHEVAEAYYGCEIALERRAGSPAAREPGSTYGEAHKSANIISCGDYHVQPILGGANKPKLRYNGDFNYPFDSRNFYLDYDTIEYKKICY